MADKSSFGFNTPFYEQLEFFRQKLNLPSERWDDIKKSAHDRAFIVAGAGKADLLNDLRRSVDKAVSQGLGLGEFRKDFDQIVLNRGWTGWTGEGTKAGEAWRTRIIYQTNMAISYSAGRWKQLNDPDLLKSRPYWRYNHADGVMHPRPLHLAWNGITLPHDHSFWKTHFTPNGWLCHCYITAASESDYFAAKAAGKGDAPDGWDSVAPKTGTPVGIDKGFDYAPGANADTPLRQMVQDKLINYPPAITKALSHDVNRYVNADQEAATFVRDVMADTSRTDQLWLGFVENPEQIFDATQINTTGFMVMLPADTPRHVELSHGHDVGTQRPATSNDYSQVWQVLAAADMVALSKTSSIHGNQMVVVTKQVGGEVFRCVFEVRPGKRNRALALWSLVIKKE